MPTESADRQADETWPSRSGERYRVAAPVWFRWKTGTAGWRTGKGITRDISGNGMFVLTFPVPVPGARIEVVVDVPSLLGSGRPVTFRGRGKVIRIEPEQGQPIGFGASLVFEDAPDQTVGLRRQEWLLARSPSEEEGL